MFQEATVSMAAFSQTASPQGRGRQFGTMLCPELPLTARTALDGSAATVLHRVTTRNGLEKKLIAWVRTTGVEVLTRYSNPLGKSGTVIHIR
jgi:hypothetical protein